MFERPDAVLKRVLELKLPWTHNTKYGDYWYLDYENCRLILYVNGLVWPFVRLFVEDIQCGDYYIPYPGIIEEITGCRPCVYLSTVTSLNQMWKDEGANDMRFRDRADQEWSTYYGELVRKIFDKLDSGQKWTFIQENSKYFKKLHYGDIMDDPGENDEIKMR